ncbi:MAG: hypothetical protein QM770_21730 [Tepidisphaeraceae bacterium]
MPEGCLTLFKYATRSVTIEDVARFAPDDLGCADYVRAFTSILTTRELPADPGFDEYEAIGLTRWDDPQRHDQPERFRRFRVLTNAVGLALTASGVGDLTPNYLVVGLLDDAIALCDRDLLRLLAPAFDELHARLVAERSEESPFTLLGTLLVRSRLNAPIEDLTALAEQIIAEEGRQTERHTGDFLFGCTNFDQLNHVWRVLVRDHLPATTPTLAVLRSALLA